MDRRALLKLGGLAAAGFTLDACAPKGVKPQVAPRPTRPPVVLAPVKASFDRIIRTTVGLRPHRPSGFMLKADKLDAKTVIHNFGHGGSGMSLAWGTAAMATDLAMAHGDRRAAVLGSGVVGLTMARELQRHGFDVTIYAATVPPDTTSNMSLAGWTPTSGLVNFARRPPGFDEQFRTAVRIAHRRLQLLVGPKYGISWITNYAPTDNEQSARGGNVLMPEDMADARELLQPGEHPFATKYCIARAEMRIEPSIYLDALMHDFVLFGGTVVIRKFETPRDVVALPESLVVNCTGLGAKALFGDADLVPLKGQLVVLIPQAECNYATSGGNRTQTAEPGLGIHMMSRSDGIILGGTSERDVWTMDVNEKERLRVVNGHIELFTSMAGGQKLS